MLNLVECSLSRARMLQKLGAEREALRAFTRLANLRGLEPGVAEEIQSRLAEMLLDRGQLRQARRHLAAALAQQPNDAHYHHLMAAALEADARAEPGRALAYRRRAVQLAPDQPRYLSDFGLLAIREGQTEEGLRALRCAHELAPNDPDVLAHLAEGLCHAERYKEARAAVRAAMFRNASDERFRQLWDDFQFQQLGAEQESARRRHLAETSRDGPMVLPFVRPQAGTTPAGSGGRIIRRDRAARRAAPHLAERARRPDQKHA
jgi:tetratricopeptide (TPR) repeat protein